MSVASVGIYILIISLSYGVNTQCTASGRFPNDIVEDCRGYTTCISTAPSSFYQYELACPSTFVYNHFDRQCTNATGYQCFPQFNCTELGVFPNPLSNNCSSYVVCIQSLTSISARLIDCPANTSFSPIDKDCVDNSLYTCPLTTTTTVASSTTASPIPTLHEEIEPPRTENVIGNSATQTYVYFVTMSSIVGFSLI